MLKKYYLLVAVFSFMVISPAFLMANEDEGSSPISTEESHKEKASQDKEAEVQSPPSQQDAEHKTPPEDLKKDSPPSVKPKRKGLRCCCLFGTEDDD